MRLTIVAAASYVGLFGILLSQALRGQSVLAPDLVTLTLLGVWAVATVAAARASLSYRTQQGSLLTLTTFLSSVKE